VNGSLDLLRVNESRFRADLEELATIGSTGNGGVDRPALGEAHLAARAWFRRRVASSGLALRVDGAGNHSAFLACGPAGGATLLLGSHLDSVPQGGQFDGALGVLAALEALRTVREAGLVLPVHLEAIDFTDEEGTLVGLLGSAALAGQLQPQSLAQPRGGLEALEAGLARAGLTRAGMLSARRDPTSLAGYLELHIEQGRRLADGGVDIGIVTEIVGIRSYQLAFLGRPDHAGTASMADRRDAAQGASAFALAVREIVLSKYAGCTANVGDMRFVPGAFNIVPGQVRVALEFRAPQMALLDQLEAELTDRAREEAERFGLGLEMAALGGHPPAPMSQAAQQAISDAAESLGLSHTRLTSRAGHDAQSLAECCPAGMVFVPSVDGASHSPREFTQWRDCVNGANVLLQAALRMAIGS
jgi:N-carbamoyl-L-amino-acid hydrolase